MKMRLGLAAVVAVVLLLTVVLVAPAPSSAANGAVIIKDSSCALFDGRGGTALTRVGQTLINHAGNGLTICKATVTPPLGGRTVRYNYRNTGLLCYVANAGFTYDWQEVVSGTGQATLRCTVHTP